MSTTDTESHTTGCSCIEECRTKSETAGGLGFGAAPFGARTPGGVRLRIAFCFLLVLFAIIEVARQVPFWEHGSNLIAWWITAGGAWAGALWLARAGSLGLRSIIPGAVLLRGVALLSFPDLSDDLYRYVWEGARVLEGVNPYAFAPNAPELVAAREAAPELFAAVNHPEVSAAYPPLMQFASAGVVALAHAVGVDAVFGMRVFFALCDLLVLWPLVVLLRRARLPLGMCVAWAWCPLVVVEFAGSGHFDSLGILLLMTALALVGDSTRGLRELGGMAALAGAVVVKYLPIAALPFLARGERRWQRVGIVALLAALSFVPFLLMGGGLQGGLGDYGLRWESGSLVQRHLEPLVEQIFSRDGRWLDSRIVTRGVLGLAWLAVGWRAWRRGLDAVHATGLMLFAFLVFSPTLHPWYVTWIVPFLALRPRASWCWLVIAIPSAYAPLARWKLEGVWESSSLAAWFLALPFFAALAWEAWSARRTR